MERQEEALIDLASPHCPNTVTVRRNPMRRARKTPATNAPIGMTPSSKSFAPKEVSRFPIEDILQCEVVSQNPLPSLPSNGETSESIRVFLRIRPIIANRSSKKKTDGANTGRSKSKGVSPKQEATKKKTKAKEICLSVNGSQSVTLTPPQSMQDSKRVKTEVYDGFTHVFDSDSIQKEVYDRVMDPLVSDFIAGKSGMLAAMGPTGSGKTHTVFGSPREPGLIPLALRKIFMSTGDNSPKLSSSYYISMFEIYSERGKGEKIFDLSSDGADISMQQATIRGLQEVLVSGVAEAEALIARGMLKRATAVTNSNSQSSRSQCIINIRAAPKSFDGEVEVLPNDAVLTIVDLAGAEREKKTGNQGTRLLESNFINNTSMVFGLCLRSLLEHQKNPKKQFQKHFQNSLLTRYLRDYLEGKKRMTLILTAKPGEDDYADTSILLRQASPYMMIKFSAVEEQPNLTYQKRNIVKMPRVEKPKRRKLPDVEAPDIDEGKIASNENTPLEKEKIAEKIQKPQATDVSVSTPRLDKLVCCTELDGVKRREKIMLDFSKAMWNVLKEYKQKLEVSNIELQTLKQKLQLRDEQCLKLEKEVEDLKSSNPCSTQHSTGLASEVGADCESGNIGSPPQAVDHSNTLQKVGEDLYVSDSDDAANNLQNIIFIKEPIQKIEGPLSLSHRREVSDELNCDCSSIEDLEKQDCQEHVKTALNQSMDQKRRSFPQKEKETDANTYLEVKDNSPNTAIAGTGVGLSVVLGGSSQSKVLVRDDEQPSLERNTACMGENMKLFAPRVDGKVGYVDEHNLRETELEGCSTQKSNQKPRRRLQPASSLLLKEINNLDLEVDNVEHNKGSRGGRKLFAEERGLTQGSVSLLRLLRTNLHL